MPITSTKLRLVRLLLVVLSVRMFSCSTAVFAQASPPCGTAAHFKTGINLDGWTGGATFQEQDQSVVFMKEAGVQLVRINTPWHALEPNQKGTYDTNLLAFYDHIVPSLSSNGMRSIFVNATTPYWASADPAKYSDAQGDHWNALYKPANFTNYADFLVFLANRYKSYGSNVFEIWNEENEPYFWPPTPSPTNYLAMLRACYTAIKQADPQALVLNGGLSDGGSSGVYLNTLYSNGARPFFDALSQHVYSRAPTNESVVFGNRSVMVARGDSAKNIWVTECGWPTYTNSADPNAVSLITQAQYLNDLYTRLAGYSYVRAAFWYNLRSFDETQKEGSFGILFPDFSKKPSFDALKNWTARAGISCPPSISSIQRLSDGNVRLSFLGTTGFVYNVECADLFTNWQVAASNLSSTNAIYSFDDLLATNSPARFYRIVWP